MNLNQLGLKHYQTKTKLLATNLPIARLISEHKTAWDMITLSTGPMKGILMNTLRKQMENNQLPKVGDWVEYDKIPGENRAKIIKVLPRYSALIRHLKNSKVPQTIAANIDVMFIVLSVDQIFNPLQLNRYLSLALEGGATPVLVINKTDKQTAQQHSAKEIVIQVLAIHPRLKIISTSATAKLGLLELEQTIKSGYTAVLVGNSGTGKSSLVNGLLAQANQSTSEVSDFGKGRHTTTSRQMFVLPNGGILIDTPGMRTLELDPSKPKSSTTAIFKELEELSRQCKYRNCDHIKSAGCALKDALAKKLISSKQLEQFLNLSTKHSQKINYNKSRN